MGGISALGKRTPAARPDDSRYARVGALPTRPSLACSPAAPLYMAHRGGSYVFPEESADAYAACFAAGLIVLDGDTQPLGDGALALIHDDTVDRTTDGTGNVSAFTVPTFLSLNAANAFPWPKTTTPGLVGDLLAKYAQSVYLSIEPKDASTLTQLLDLADAAGAQQSVIVNTDTYTVAAAAKARGYKVYAYSMGGAGGMTVSNAVALGVDFLGCSATTEAASIPTYVASGVPVVPYNVNTRALRNTMIGLGCSGFLTDQPVYLPRATAMTTVASWTRNTLGHGATQYPVHPVVGYLAANASGLVLTPQSASGQQYVTLGELCPLANAAGSYTLDCDLGWDTTPSNAGSAVLLFFGLPDDAGYDLASGASVNPHPASGWMAYLKKDGSLQLYKLDNSGSAYTAVGGTFATTALTTNLAHLKIAVTATTVTVARTDAAGAIATLSGALTSGTPITALPVNALAAGVASGKKLYLPTGQLATVSSTASAGATSIAVSSLTPSATIASGSVVAAAVQVTDSTGRGGYCGVGRTPNSADAALASRYKALTVT